MSNRLQANILLILILVGLFFIALAPSVFAADITFTPQISIPGVSAGKISPTSIGSYIIAIYKYAIGIVGILATVVMMIGGIIWLTAGGNSTRIEDAKSWISASLTGLIIALCSFLILSTVNPALTTFKPIGVDTVGKATSSSSNLDLTKGCCLAYYRVSILGCGNNIMKDDCRPPTCGILLNSSYTPDSCDFSLNTSCTGSGTNSKCQ